MLQGLRQARVYGPDGPGRTGRGGVVRHRSNPTRFESLRACGRELARALRTAAQRPTFSLVAVATLGVGIGASTATLSIADAVLLRPLPVHEQRRLAVLWGVDRAAGSQRVPIPFAAFQAFVDASPTTLTAVAALDYHGAGTHPVREGTDGVNLKVASVTGNLFGVLGVAPLLGRNLQPADDSPAAAPVVAISYELWQRRYGSNPAVLGRVLTIRGQPGTIVAVMPRGFAFPAQTDVWATVRPFRPVAQTYVYVVGRLAPDATIEQSASELTTYLRSNLAVLPEFLRGTTASAEAFDDDLLGKVRPIIRLLMVASALVMLVALVNVGTLFLTLGLTKRLELAVRRSLGATPMRLVLLVFSDALIVAAAGAMLGIAVAYGIVRLVVVFASTQLPRADAIEVDGATLAFAVALGLTATIAFALAFVYGQRRGDPSHVLNAARGGTGSRAARRAQQALVVAQVTLAVTVILGAGLVARSQVNLESLDLGLDGDRILVAQVVPPQQDDWANPTRFNANLDRVIAAIVPLPGVQSVAPILSEPFGGMSGWDARYLLEGEAPEAQTRHPLVSLEMASPAFFQTLGIEILRGRAFTDEDGANGRPVVILSESAARLAWPESDAVGRRMQIAGVWATVVGVAANTRYRELTAPRPTAYRPRAQLEAAPGFLAVRMAGDPTALAPAIRRVGAEAWPGVTFTSMRRLDRYASEPLARSRVTAALFVGFAAVCLLLSTIGLYGVVTAQTADRTRDIGIRMALGASGARVLRSVLFEGARMTLIGMIAGATIAASFSSWLESILYGVSRHDPATIAAVALLMCLVTGAASYIPARRASRIAPTEALREG
jgi:putative ABC transport system permease protein